MSYYDHATAMAFKLGRWREARAARNFELEARAAEQRAATNPEKQQAIQVRWLSISHLANTTKAIASDIVRPRRGDND